MSTPLEHAGRAPEDNFSDSDSESDNLNPVENDEGWEDVEPEDESQPVVGLFTAEVYPDVRAMLKDTKEKYNLDLVKVQKDLGAFSFALLGIGHLWIAHTQEENGANFAQDWIF